MAWTEGGGAGAIDGDRWRFELEEEITSSSSSSSSLPFGRLILGVTAMLARARRRGGAVRCKRDFGVRAICQIWSSYIIRYDTRFRAEQF